MSSLVFEFVDGTQEVVWPGSPRHRELLADGHAPVGSVPESDGISDALEAYLDGRPVSDEALPERLSAASLSATIASGVGTVLLRDLDIWDPYDAGASDTYTGFMAYVDALFAGAVTAGTVTRTDHGLASNGTSHIYSFTAGATRGPHLLLVGGTHPNESLSMKAPMRWFEQFALGTHPAMVALRQNLRVTWIPVLTPSGYRTSRFNANSVNVNRNFDFYWNYYTAPSANSAKGTAPFSEVEAQLIKSLLDNNKIAALIDCHTIAATTPDEMSFIAPSPWVLAKRNLAFSAGSLWEQLYDTNNVGARHIGSDYRSVPTMSTWAAKYLRHDKKRYNAATVAVESPEQWRGSTMNNITREAMRHYCGYITLWVREWLMSGQSIIEPRPMMLYAYKQYSATTTQNISVTLGGTKIDQNGAWQTIVFDRFDDYLSDPGGARDYIDLVQPAPGAWHVTIDGYIESRGAAGKLLIAAGWDDAAAGTTTADVTSYQGIEVPAISGDRCWFSTSLRVGSTTIGQINRLRAMINKSGSFTAPELQRIRVKAEFYPFDTWGNRGSMELPVRWKTDSV